MKQGLLIILIVFCLLSVVALNVACDRGDFSEEVIAEEVLQEENETPCLSEVIYYVPINYSGSMEITFDVDDLCYDFLNDPLGLEAKVDRVFEEHPDDWNEHMNWSSHDSEPVVTFIRTDNVTEPTRVNIFNGTRM